jgi:hypothetical protein
MFVGRLCVPGLGARRIALDRTSRLDSRPTDTSANHYSAKEAQLRWEKARWIQRVINLEAEKIALEAIIGKLKEQDRALPVDKVDINTAAIDLEVTGPTFDKSIRCPNMLPASSCDRFAVVGVRHQSMRTSRPLYNVSLFHHTLYITSFFVTVCEIRTSRVPRVLS